MSIEYHFPLPFYRRKAEGPGLEALQDELWNACNQSSFDHIPGWNKGTHKLSDNAFGDCVIKKYNCIRFIKHLDFCLKNYLETNSLPEYTITSSWFTKTVKHEHAHLHDHGPSDVSGVYYLQTNGEDGNLHFNSPIHFLLARNYVIGGQEGGLEVQPQEGLLFLWPSFLMHMTAENRTDSERISLSFNIKIH